MKEICEALASDIEKIHGRKPDNYSENITQPIEMTMQPLEDPIESSENMHPSQTIQQPDTKCSHIPSESEALPHRTVLDMGLSKNQLEESYDSDNEGSELVIDTNEMDDSESIASVAEDKSIAELPKSIDQAVPNASTSPIVTTIASLSETSTIYAAPSLGLKTELSTIDKTPSTPADFKTTST